MAHDICESLANYVDFVDVLLVYFYNALLWPKQFNFQILRHRKCRLIVHIEALFQIVQILVDYNLFK